VKTRNPTWYVEGSIFPKYPTQGNLRSCTEIELTVLSDGRGGSAASAVRLQRTLFASVISSASLASRVGARLALSLGFDVANQTRSVEPSTGHTTARAPHNSTSSACLLPGQFELSSHRPYVGLALVVTQFRRGLVAMFPPLQLISQLGLGIHRLPAELRHHERPTVAAAPLTTAEGASTSTCWFDVAPISTESARGVASPALGVAAACFFPCAVDRIADWRAEGSLHSETCT
jgi:hypothetical protein